MCVVVSVLDCRSRGSGLKSRPRQKFGSRFLLHLAISGTMSTLTVHCQWEDEAAREKIGHPPSYAQAKKMKSLTLNTHGCSRVRLKDCPSSFPNPRLFLRGLTGFRVLRCRGHGGKLGPISRISAYAHWMDEPFSHGNIIELTYMGPIYSLRKCWQSSWYRHGGGAIVYFSKNYIGLDRFSDIVRMPFKDKFIHRHPLRTMSNL